MTFSEGKVLMKRWAPVTILDSAKGKFMNYIDYVDEENARVIVGARISVKGPDGYAFWAIVPIAWVCEDS